MTLHFHFRLELLNRSATINRSLFNELELSTDFRTTSGLSATSSGIGGDDDTIECDDSSNLFHMNLKEVISADVAYVLSCKAVGYSVF